MGHSPEPVGAAQQESFKRWKALAVRYSFVRLKTISSPFFYKSCSSHLVGSMDIALLRQLLGHRNIQNTMVYAHANHRQASRAAMAAEMAAFRK
jgi:site-specific recombinase XerD